MAFKLNSKTLHGSFLFLDDILPKISGRLTVKYAQKEYMIIGYLDDGAKLILKDPQQPDCELRVNLESVKPLLRKMGSMTDDEKEHYQSLLDDVKCGAKNVWEATEWLNRNLFDYKNLIGQGLAEEKY